MKTVTIWIVILVVVAVVVGVTLTKVLLPPTYDPYDVNHNCKIEMVELLNAIDDWKHGSYDLGDLMRTMGRWKRQSYC